MTERNGDGTGRRLARLLNWHKGWYLAAGVASLALDVVALYVLHSLLGVELVVATTVAYLLGLAANYVINRTWVFTGTETVLRSAARYLTLVAFNYSATVALVTGFSALDWPYLGGKALAIGLTTLWNYPLYLRWVFKRAS